MDSPIFSALIVVVICLFAFRMLPRLLAGVPFVEPVSVHKRLEEDDEAILIDVRTPEEFANAHAVGSLNVQPNQLTENLNDKLAYKENKIYVICQTAQRAAMSARVLKKFGFNNVSVVKGGLLRWKKQKLPIE